MLKTALKSTAERGQAEWQHDQDTWTLTLRGDWPEERPKEQPEARHGERPDRRPDGQPGEPGGAAPRNAHGAGTAPAHAAAAPHIPPLPHLPHSGNVVVDGSGLTGWHTALAAAVWQVLAPIDRRKVALDLQRLPEGLRAVLALALPGPPPTVPGAAPPRDKVKRRLRKPNWVTELGFGVEAAWARGLATLRFFGEVVLALGRWVRGRSDLRAVDLLWQIDQTGPRSVPIVSLVCGLVGLILAYMGAIQLQRFGAESYIADLVSVGVVREIAALMTGVILSGRVGAAFAAQIGSMQANEEIDALRTLGIDPVDYLVLPRLLAMALVAPLLTAAAALVGMLAGWLVATAVFGVPPLDYLVRSLQALTVPNVSIGLFKGTVYAMLVALAGCRQGLSAGRSAEAVGQATTAAVVQAIVWIVVSASVLTIVFQRLGW
jgi:phospholipid/cholesterol/gamma-HCH transport system permease protein